MSLTKLMPFIANCRSWQLNRIHLMNSIFRSILNSILPPRCIRCGAILSGDDGLCPDCFNEMSFISSPYCRRCGHPFDDVPDGHQLLCGSCLKNKRTPFRFSRSAFRYDDGSKSLVLGLKFLDKTENAKVLARWLQNAGRDIWNEGVDVIIPVPLHYLRLVKRRYNQSALLARELHKLVNIPVDFDSVERHKNTRPQVEFSGHERIRNVKGAFRVKYPKKIKGQRIVLIDDVLTTGSTLKECALALKKAGAKSVDTLTVARVC